MNGNDELEKMWKEDVMTRFKTLFRLCLWGMGKTKKKHSIARFIVEIRTEESKNMKQRFKLLHRDVYWAWLFDDALSAIEFFSV
jgi:hypothetical protein